MGRRILDKWDTGDWGKNLDTEAVSRGQFVAPKPRAGNVGPARRAFRCEGPPCWEPNRFGWCKGCGGDAPQRGAR